MILTLFFEALLGFVQAVVSVLPSWSGLTTTVTNFTTAAADMGTRLSTFGNWLPLDTMHTCIAGIAASFGTAVTIRLGRFFISLMTGGGGS